MALCASPSSSQVTGQFEGTAQQLAALRDSVWRASCCADVRLCEVAAGRERSLRNLHAYLALRSADLTALQRALDRMGLASLDHAEAHVLATLDATLVSVGILADQTPDAPDLLQTIDDFDEGPAQLEENADRLLGPARVHRRARVMITLPDNAADDPCLLAAMMRDGMDCARINCAYGDQAHWSRTLEALREAQAAAGRSCRVFMDLRGPKLRTGTMAPEPGILKVRPSRAADGRVLRPARVWLTAAPHTEPDAADATLTLDNHWLEQLRADDCIRLRDARGSNRKWRISERTPDGCWAESRKTTYLVNGTVLRLQRDGDRPGLTTTLDSLPPRESRLTVREGDLLQLKLGNGPGRPAVHDPEGRLLRTGTLALDVAAVFRDARAGEPISFDDGRISGLIETVDPDALLVRVQHTRRPEERLSSDKGVNLPATFLDLPALSDEDLQDLDFITRNADIVGLSFTNDAADVRYLHERLRRLGRQNVGVILKIETGRGCANLPAILIEGMKFPNFGVMVARGDLAAECGFERLGELQDDVLRLCESAHVPVVWATGVLDRLARRGHPTRAEITDASAAQRAECVMLGKGAFIGRALRTLDDLLCRMRPREYKHQHLLGELRFGANAPDEHIPARS